MKCIQCKEDAEYIYNGNSLCSTDFQIVLDYEEYKEKAKEDHLIRINKMPLPKW